MGTRGISIHPYCVPWTHSPCISAGAQSWAQHMGVCWSLQCSGRCLQRWQELSWYWLGSTLMFNSSEEEGIPTLEMSCSPLVSCCHRQHHSCKVTLVRSLQWLLFPPTISTHGWIEVCMKPVFTSKRWEYFLPLTQQTPFCKPCFVQVPRKFEFM